MLQCDREQQAAISPDKSFVHLKEADNLQLQLQENVHAEGVCLKRFGEAWLEVSLYLLDNDVLYGLN